MRVQELASQLNYELLTPGLGNNDIRDGYTSDLLSDVMGNAPDESVLITIQAHKNTVAVATLAGISAILLCNNRQAPEDMLEAANKEGVAIVRAPDNQFVASYKVHDLLK